MQYREISTMCLPKGVLHNSNTRWQASMAGGHLTTPRVRSSWQLMAAKRGVISLLHGWNPWWVSQPWLVSPKHVNTQLYYMMDSSGCVCIYRSYIHAHLIHTYMYVYMLVETKITEKVWIWKGVGGKSWAERVENDINTVLCMKFWKIKIKTGKRCRWED